MNAEQNIAVVRRYLEELRRNNLSIIDELISPNFFSHSENLMPSNKMEIMRNQAETVSSIEERELTYTYSVQGDWVVVLQYQVFRLVRPMMGFQLDKEWHAGEYVTYWRVQHGQIVEWQSGEMRKFY